MTAYKNILFVLEVNNGLIIVSCRNTASASIGGYKDQKITITWPLTFTTICNATAIIGYTSAFTAHLTAISNSECSITIRNQWENTSSSRSIVCVLAIGY